MTKAGVLMAVLAAVAAQPPAIKPSQHGSVTQLVATTTITVDYNRPVARGRELFGALVPYDRVWCPGADDCTTLTVSTDVTIEGHALPAGTYSLWRRPLDADPQPGPPDFPHAIPDGRRSGYSDH